VTHVRTVRRNAQVALELQRALLPKAPPTFPDLAVSARYIAGVTDVEVGGDWWDVVDLGAGQVALGVGDVSGRGVPAAVVMGQTRAAMRAAGFAHLSPVEVMSILDEQVAELVGPGDNEPTAPPRFATALYGVLEPASAILRLSNAGHLPPLVRSAAGDVRIVELPPATPLGLRIGGWEEVRVRFPAGSTVAMFTDGLVESRGQEFDDGITELAAAFENLGSLPDLEDVTVGLLRAMGRDKGHVDDVALLLLRVDESAFPVAAYDTLVEHAFDVSAARRAAADVLARTGSVTSEVVDRASQIISELLANGLEHGRSAAALHVHVTGVRAVVEVTDQALARPILRDADSIDERGRGLALTKALSSRWGVRTGSEGKTVWSEILLT
jgi:hypothetical protein